MISAWFQNSDNVKIPAVFPDAEIAELAAMSGVPFQDLFSIDIPGGASRETRIKVLIAQSDLNTLYASEGVYGIASVRFHWFTDEDTEMAMYVSLLPPRPLFMVPSAQGVAVVEAVDARYWWKRTQLNAVNITALRGQMFSSDGRWMVNSDDAAMTPSNLLSTLVAALPYGVATLNTSGYAPDALLINRVADHVFTPECSVAMAIDLLLMNTGYVCVWTNGVTGLCVTQIKNDDVTIRSFMSDHKIAMQGGLEATSGTAAGSEPLMTLWEANANYQVNRMPPSASVSFPFRTVEGKTAYDNATTLRSGEIQFAYEREYGIQGSIATTRSRTSVPASLVVKEPRALVASAAPTPFTPATSGSNTLNTPTPPAWARITYEGLVRELLRKRCELSIGTTVWGGWADFPTGAYRGTMLRYTLGHRHGDLVPITITKCDDSDWVFGPDGLTPSDPHDIVVSKGMIHARRLGSGVLQLDVAPPNCRFFPAKVTGHTRIDVSGNGYWKWTYTWEEVEPNPLASSPEVVSLSTWARTGTSARNLTEDSNVYISDHNNGNVIAPGVLQSDYTNAKIEPLPIADNTIVLMCEQFLTSYLGDGTTFPPFARRFWFSMPNAVKVTCD